MEPDRRFRRILTFLAVTYAFSSLFYFLILRTGTLDSGRGIYVLGLMWSPGFAALLTCKLTGKRIVSLGWGWGQTRYQIVSYFLPLAYSLAAYVPTWISGLGGFYNQETVQKITASYGWQNLSAGMTILFFFILFGIFALPRSLSSSLGEEIGWRGFLVPELFKVTSFTKTAVISGLIWATWHYPLLLFADYNSGTPAWYGLTCFTVMVVGISFPFAWLRLKSGSLWTAAILHASHNLFIQGIFTPLTNDTGITEYVIDEFGAALAVVSIVVAFLFWKRRYELEGLYNRRVPLVTPESSALLTK
jgi:CAAX protease family protein